MRIRIDSFKGMAPRVQPRQLPAGFAQAAVNTIMDTGSLRPLRAAETAYTFAADTAVFLRHNNAWYGWADPDVCAVPGPVAQDRLYVTGDGPPKLLYQGDSYPLALPAPPDAPTVQFTNRPADPVPDDPGDAIADLPAAGGTTPTALRVVRQPAGSLSGYTLQTQPAIALVDEAGLLCDTDNTTEVSVEIAEGVLGFLGGTRTVTAVNGIVRFTDLTLAGDDATDYYLGFSAADLDDIRSGHINVTTDFSSLESTVLYAYTFVTSLGEESAPSPMSASLEWYPGLKVELGNFSAAPAGRLITKMRIYRTVTSASGVTDLYFVAEVPASTLTYEHDLEVAPIVEVIPSADYDPPPDDMDGIIALPNGMMAAFSGRELLFSEPYKPHAWPTKYRLNTDYDIVGLGAFGGSVAVLTTGTPYIATGSAPELMTMERLEINLPCLARRGIADLGYSIAYPSVDGLVMVGTTGAQVITKSMLTRDQWRALDPASFIAEPYAGLYVASRLVNAGTGARAVSIFDVSGEAPFMVGTDEDVRALHADIASGTLYAIEADDMTEVRAWDAASPKSMTWRSGIARTGAPTNFGAAMITAASGAASAMANIYADGVLCGTIPAKNTPCRLPSGFLASEWEIEIIGAAEVFAVTIATTMEELTNE